MLQCCATCFDMPLSLYKLSKTYHEWYSWKLGTSFCGFKSTSPFPHCPFTCYEMLSMTRQCSVHKSVGTHAFIYASKLAQVFRFQGAADVAPAILDGGISWSKIRGFPQGRNFPHICSPKRDCLVSMICPMNSLQPTNLCQWQVERTCVGMYGVESLISAPLGSSLGISTYPLFPRESV